MSPSQRRTGLVRRLYQALAAPALLALLCASAVAQDYMGMVEQYGWNVQSILRTEILNDAARRTMEQAGGGQAGGAPQAAASWPGHISEASIGSHVFSVDELMAMRDADPARYRNLIEGRVISVQGSVTQTARERDSFSVVNPDRPGYRVWAYWQRNVPELPRVGSTVILQGVADLKRSSYVIMRGPDILDARASVASPSNGPEAGAGADYAALAFSSSPEVTRMVNEQLVDQLAPSLTIGVTRQDLLDVFKSGQLQAAFSQILSDSGFSDRDLGDVMAAHLIILWQVAHDAPDIDFPEGYQAIRTKMRDALASTAWVGLLDDSQKQTLAEMLGTGSTLIVSVYADALQKGDAAAKARAAEDARQMAASVSGFDLMAFNLTDRGFEPR